ncbi:hypothetical protein QTP70_030684, partial [Hemibagrus guttatus]
MDQSKFGTREAFTRLKTSFTTVPILWHPDPDLPFILEVDASSCGIGAILFQRHRAPGKLHPCATPGNSPQLRPTMTWAIENSYPSKPHWRDGNIGSREPATLSWYIRVSTPLFPWSGEPSDVPVVVESGSVGTGTRPPTEGDQEKK